MNNALDDASCEDCHEQYCTGAGEEGAVGSGCDKRGEWKGGVAVVLPPCRRVSSLTDNSDHESPGGLGQDVRGAEAGGEGHVGRGQSRR